jgi:hypothetical protein
VSEPQSERRKHEDDADVRCQPGPDVVPEEQDIHGHHDSDQAEHVQRHGHVSSHGFILSAGGLPEGRVSLGGAECARRAGERGGDRCRLLVPFGELGLERLDPDGVGETCLTEFRALFARQEELTLASFLVFP